jgi:hypothetical protein
MNIQFKINFDNNIYDMVIPVFERNKVVGGEVLATGVYKSGRPWRREAIVKIVPTSPNYRGKVFAKNGVMKGAEIFTLKESGLSKKHIITSFEQWQHLLAIKQNEHVQKEIAAENAQQQFNNMFPDKQILKLHEELQYAAPLSFSSQDVPAWIQEQIREWEKYGAFNLRGNLYKEISSKIDEELESMGLISIQ